MTSSLLEAALSYAARGWPVFPLNGKEPITPNGVKDATIGEDQIKTWWTEKPAANIGLACGEASAVVVDDDGPLSESAIVEYARVRGIKTAESDLSTVRAKTRKGEHLYFAWSDGCEKLKNWTKPIPDTDIRTTGGYVVAPPSIHPDTGTAYEWIVPPENGNLKPFPGWLLDFILESKVVERTEKLEKITTAANRQKAARLRDDGTIHPYAKAALEGELSTLRASIPGVNRNDTLNTSALKLFGLVKGGVLDKGETWRELARVARSIGLTDSEIEKTLNSAWSGSAARDIPEDSRPVLVVGGGNNGARAITEEELATRKADSGPEFKLNLPGNHYLTRYIAYGRDISDAYPDYWLAGGLHQLAVIADKKIWIKLRQGPIYPNLYIFIAGRSSLSRKSTAVDISEALLNDHRPGTSINAVPTEFSPEAFIEHLDMSPHAPWVRDEAAGVLSSMRRDYMRGFKDSLMQLYDCRPIHRKLRTNQRKNSKTDFQVDDPYLNVMWATTDSALSKNTEINDTLSGFLARFIYHFPRRPKERWLPLEEGEAMNSELELVVRGQLAAMSNMVAEMTRRQLRFGKEAGEYWTTWQRERALEMEDRDDANEMQIHSRLVPLVAKLAMLFELGSSDFDHDRPIRLEYVVEACRLVDEYYQPMAMAVYDMVGRDLERNVIDRIIAFLKRHGGVSTKREISRHVKIKAKELQEYLDTMAGDETIEYCEVANPGGGISSVKVVLTVNSVTDVTRVNTVTTVTSNTKDQEDKRNTGSEEKSSSYVEGVTEEEPKLGDNENPGDPGDSGDSRDSRYDSIAENLAEAEKSEAEWKEHFKTPEPTPKDGDARIFGLSIPYYLDLGGGQIPTVAVLMQDQNWPVEKAKMAVDMLKGRA